MKILIATGIFPPQIGGPATYSKLLYDELPKRGIDVEVVNFGDYIDKPKLIRHFLYFRELLRLASSVDVIYAQDPVSVGLPALLAAQVTKKRFFIRVAGDYAWEQATQRFGVTDSIEVFQEKKYGLRTETLKKIERFVVNGADTVITPSHYFQQIVSTWCDNSDKVKVIYNGIEALHDLPTKTAARSTLGIQRLDKIIVSSGRLVPWKGFALLIQIVSELKAEGRRVKLRIVGDGPDRALLEAEVLRLGVGDDVIFLGSLSRADMLQNLICADVFALNSGFESFSFQIVEAMRVGVPVVSTRVGSIPELIGNDSEGLLVPWNSHDELKMALEKAISDQTFRKESIKNAKKKSLSFSIQATLDNLIGLL